MEKQKAKRRKHESERRTLELKIRVTKEEKEKIKELNNTGLQDATYIREVLLNTIQKRFKKKKMNPELTNQLARIGNNLNQCAKKLNSFDAINDNELKNIFTVMIEIEKSLKILREI